MGVDYWETIYIRRDIYYIVFFCCCCQTYIGFKLLHKVKKINVIINWKNIVKNGYGNLYSEKVNSNLLIKVVDIETDMYKAYVVNIVPEEFIKNLPPLLESEVAGKGKPPRLVDICFKNKENIL